MITRRKILTWVTAGLVSAMGLISTAVAQGLPQVTLETSMGNIVLELDSKNAPLTTENFLKYTQSGHYNGTIFHRVIPSFMVQGGGFTADMNQKQTLAPIKLETSPALKNTRGTVAMARTGNPHSATSQFFINVVDNEFLNAASSADGQGYAVFGRVVSGMDVVDKIRKVQTGQTKGHQDVPTTPVVINKVSVTSK